MLTVVEETTASLSSSQRKALKSAIPEFVVKTLEIGKGDKLAWEVMDRDGKKGFFFTKKDEQKLDDDSQRK